MLALSCLYDRYVLKNLIAVCLVTALTLAAIILLTQSLKFLELIIESGASSATFWSLAFLALPRFFEVILPIAVMISIIFIYQKMHSDSELVILRSSGRSTLALSKPAFIIAIFATLILLFVSMWLAPKTLASMNQMRDVIRAQYSAVIFKQGVFNSFGKDITVYISHRNSAGEMEGLMIYDSRPENTLPSTILAKKGVILSTEQGQKVLVYDGSRQDINPETGALNRLDFERYSIDLPNTSNVRDRYRDFDERTFFELLDTDWSIAKNQSKRDQFIIEAHRRVIGPFLALTFSSVILCFILLGPSNRRGNTSRITLGVLTIILLQSLYLLAFNWAQSSFLGIVYMYIIVFVPLFAALFILSRAGEALRHKLLSLSGG